MMPDQFLHPLANSSETTESEPSAFAHPPASVSIFPLSVPPPNSQIIHVAASSDLE
ncbi:hypothetical protein HK100_008306, partial [Physocladia obscura]